MESEAVNVAERFKSARADAARKKGEADKKAPLEDEDGNPTELKNELESLELVSLSEVTVALEEAEAKASEIDANPDGKLSPEMYCFYNFPSGQPIFVFVSDFANRWLLSFPFLVVRQYEQRKREIGDLEEKLNRLTGEKDREVEGLMTDWKRWAEGLEEHIEKVNHLFTAYMAEMGCTGEVVLYKGEADAEGSGDSTQDDTPTGKISDWGIQILVSFRENQKAVVLSKDRHSGGERSVSTIMYLMALQDMMVAPFRCVGKNKGG